MCLRCGGYGHIARNCKAPAKLQHGRRYKNLSSWSHRKRSSRTRIRTTSTRIRSPSTRVRTTSTLMRSLRKHRHGGRRRRCRRDHGIRRHRVRSIATRVRSSRSGRMRTCRVRLNRQECRCVFVVYEQCVYMVAHLSGTFKGILDSGATSSLIGLEKWPRPGRPQCFGFRGRTG